MIVREKKRLIDARRRAVLAATLSLPVMMIGMAAPVSRVWHWAQYLLAFQSCLIPYGYSVNSHFKKVAIRFCSEIKGVVLSGVEVVSSH